MTNFILYIFIGLAINVMAGIYKINAETKLQEKLAAPLFFALGFGVKTALGLAGGIVGMAIGFVLGLGMEKFTKSLYLA